MERECRKMTVSPTARRAGPGRSRARLARAAAACALMTVDCQLRPVIAVKRRRKGRRRNLRRWLRTRKPEENGVALFACCPAAAAAAAAARRQEKWKGEGGLWRSWLSNMHEKRRIFSWAVPAAAAAEGGGGGSRNGRGLCYQPTPSPVSWLPSSLWPSQAS